MKENFSPEERLLRLIKGKKTVSPADANKPQKSKEGALAHKAWSSVNLQKIAPVLFFLACAYLLFSLIHPLISLKKMETSAGAANDAGGYRQQLDIDIKPVDFYLEASNRRRIFGAISSEQQAAEGGPGPAANTELLKDITLLGIVSGENPQAIIEDKKAQKTYYLTKGQFIGEFKIEDIQEGKVVLIYRDEKFELYM